MCSLVQYPIVLSNNWISLMGGVCGDTDVGQHITKQAKRKSVGAL